MTRGRRAGPCVLLAVVAVLSSVPATSSADPAGHVRAVVTTSPLDASLELRDPVVPVGRWTRAVVSVHNRGPDALVDMAVSLHVPEAVSVRPTGAQRRPRLPTGTRQVGQALCAATVGNHVVVATVTAQTDDGTTFTTQTPARLLVGTPAPGPADAPRC